MVQLALWGLEALGFIKRHRKAFAYGALALAILTAATVVYVRIDRYFDGVTETRTKLTAAEAEARRLNARIVGLGRTIDLNEANHRREREQLAEARRIAEQERDAAVARAARYERIRDAAREAPVEDRGPVSPVVRDTIDLLWPQP